MSIVRDILSTVRAVQYVGDVVINVGIHFECGRVCSSAVLWGIIFHMHLGIPLS